jgi:endo-1,4-beta-mannosidase
LSPSTVAASLRTIRLVNYYPAYHGWSRMWFEWDPQAIWDDFRAIRAMNANAVRLILHVDVFGYPIPSLTMTERLASAVSMAEAQGLRVQLTLFDNWSQYGDLENSKRWARAILAPYEADTRIALVEVKNEMDPRDTAAMKWARAMIPYMRGVARRPVVASARVFGADSLYGFGRLVKALQGTGRPDAYSFHYYGPHAEARQRFASARSLAGTTPIWIGETGFADATYASAPPDPEKENEQAFYLYQVELAAGDLGLGAAAPWTLRDFAPGTLTSTSPGYEYRMGLIRLDGTRKPAYDAVKLVFGWFVEKYGN